MNEDDRLSLDPLARVEGGDALVEPSHLADVCPQTTMPEALDELTQLSGSVDHYGCGSAVARIKKQIRAGEIQTWSVDSGDFTHVTHDGQYYSADSPADPVLGNPYYPNARGHLGAVGALNAQARLQPPARDDKIFFQAYR